MAADPRSPAARAQLADATSGCRSWLHPPQCPGGRAYGPGRDLGRSRDHAGAGQRAQRAHGSHLFHARLAAAMRGTQAGAGAGGCARGPAAHRCRADLAQSLRSSRPRQREALARQRRAPLYRCPSEAVDGAARHRPGRNSTGGKGMCTEAWNFNSPPRSTGGRSLRDRNCTCGRLGGIGPDFIGSSPATGLQPDFIDTRKGWRRATRSGARLTWRSSPSALFCCAGS